ncbi:permease [Clostridium formicaceticum]|uniref:Permease n=1 Tax=Clostridium formicaceticum TaxID=1497 RepID=A0AAC9RIN2_9CLOT|nr:permease [Clostridium formicaceticum]AOY75694.1 permease [Clostridium formicaceticum]ARE86013.1 putative permease [Clostridium formicaceticum]
MKKMLKRYRFFFAMFSVLALVTLTHRSIGVKAIGIATFSFKEMAMIVPPVFLLLGLLDVWVPKELMIKYMGEDSGIKGTALAFLMGSAAAGPLYAAFPAVLILIKKGAGFKNILVFIGAWSTTKIPTLLFEISALGKDFALTRLMINIPGIIIMAHLLNYFVASREKENIYENVKKLEKA